MRKSIIAFGVLSTLIGVASVSANAATRGPVRFYDQNGGDRGYLWCLKAGISIFDCNYFTRAQCAMSASARRVECVVNPHAIVRGYDPNAPVVEKKKVRRQVN